MSKFCMQCGKEIENDDMHCLFCGALQDNDFDSSLSVSSSDDNPSQPQKGGGIVVPIVAAAAVVLVVLIVFMNLTIFNNGYKAPIDNVIEAINSNDADYLEDSLPDFIVESDEYDRKAAEKTLDAIYSSANKDPGLSYEVTEKKQLSDSKLSKLEDSIKNKYDESVDVENGYEVKMKITVKTNDKKRSADAAVEVYEIDGDWCFISADDFFDDI